MKSTGRCNLNGLGVLVTRPRHQADGLCRLIEEAGGRALRFPALEIDAPEEPGPVRAQLAQLDTYDLVIFISPNAVKYTLQIRKAEPLPKNLMLAAVGKGTAHALEQAGWRVNIVPQGRFDSEALLATPELTAVDGKRVLIIRGEGGRALLGETLIARGAEVRYAEVYRRCLPDADPLPVIQQWSTAVDVVTVTSVQILDNLCQLLAALDPRRLYQTPLLVVSERIRTHAKDLGFSRILLAPTTDEQVMIETLCTWVSDSMITPDL